MVAWTGTSWRWHLPELPPHLSEAFCSLTLPVSASVPLHPGQAWHIADSMQLFSNRLTEILTVSTYSTPRGFRSDIVYRHWQLPHPVLSPTLRTVVTKTSPPQLYHGSRQFLDLSLCPPCVPPASSWSPLLAVLTALVCPLRCQAWTLSRMRRRYTGFYRQALSSQFSGIWIPVYDVSIPSPPGTKKTFK